MNNILRIGFIVCSLALVLIACSSKQSTRKPTEVATLDPYKAHSFVVNNPITGTEIKLVEVGRQHRNTIVLVHGLGNNASKDWYKLVPELSKSNHVLMLDLPGFGGSQYDKEQFYTPELYSSLLNWVVKQYSHPKPTVIGHSLGGAVSVKFASDYPEQLDKLILFDVAGILQESVFARYMTQVQASSSSKNPLKRVLGSIKNKVGLITDRVIRSGDSWLNAQKILSSSKNRDFLFKDRPNANAAAGLISEDFSEEIRNISVPTLIIWGEKDPVTPLRTGQILNKHFSQSLLAVINDSGHSPMLDNPQESLKQISEWLKDPRAVHLSNNDDLSKGNISCDNKDNISYTGKYDKIVLKDCDKILLKDIQATEIVIKNSKAELINVSVSDGAYVKESDLKVTNLSATGRVGLTSIDNQLDIAGSDFNGTETAILIKGNNVVYWSVSSFINNQGAQQFLHGRTHYKKTTEL